MKKNKIIMYFAIIILILFILVIGFLIINNNKNKKIIEEYTPAQEISEKQLRYTNVMLYFLSTENNELSTEIRQIDAKKLLENPEKILINFLQEGPKDINLIKLIPENTKLINTEINNGILIINFSREFIEGQNLGLEYETKIIQSILKTVGQLNEINGIKILIEGEENMEFSDGEINFKEIFMINN